jgi:hypothetical protein
MSKRQRFEMRIACNVSAAVGEAFEQLAANSSLTESDYLRDALSEYLIRRGMLQPPRQSNGAMHPAE